MYRVKNIRTGVMFTCGEAVLEVLDEYIYELVELVSSEEDDASSASLGIVDDTEE